MRTIQAILATDLHGAIANESGIPWNIPSDLRRLALITKKAVLIMGRKTWDDVGALPGRHSIVITSKESEDRENVTFVPDFDAALKAAWEVAGDKREIFAFGGKRIYEEAFASVWLTQVHLTTANLVIDNPTAIVDTNFSKKRFQSIRQNFTKVYPNDEAETAYTHVIASPEHVLEQMMLMAGPELHTPARDQAVYASFVVALLEDICFRDWPNKQVNMGHTVSELNFTKLLRQVVKLMINLVESKEAGLVEKAEDFGKRIFGCIVAKQDRFLEIETTSPGSDVVKVLSELNTLIAEYSKKHKQLKK